MSEDTEEWKDQWSGTPLLVLVCIQCVQHNEKVATLSLCFLMQFALLCNLV